MACKHCTTKSGTYTLTDLCCAARFARDQATETYERTKTAVAAKYGHTTEAIEQEAKRQRARAVREAVPGMADR